MWILVVKEDGEIVYDKLVKLLMEIMNYNIEYSGIMVE